jgi:serine/threonine-protein kinase
MAPEIILGDVEVDRRADVCAVGGASIPAQAGELVFEADTPLKMLMQHLNAEPTPPSARSELPIPRELDELVLACLQKDPNKRPQDAQELLRLAMACKACERWNQEAAQLWWQRHLSELTGPLTLTTPSATPSVTESTPTLTPFSAPVYK